MWAGGKSKLLSKYEPHLPEKFDSYHEPFFGGGAMFIWAYQKNPDAKFFINDINPHIINIYKSIRGDVEYFCSIVDEFEKKYLSLDPPTEKKIIEGKTKWLDHPTGAKDKELEKEHKLPGNKYNWHEIYEIKPTRRSFFFKTRQSYQEDYHAWSPVREAAVLYFLMKTAFNGVWQVGKGHGRFNTPCGLMRHDKEIYKKKNVMEWHKALQGCQIDCVDFQDTLLHIGPDSYTFLDPPYRSASSEEQTFADYGTELGDDFQEKVLDFFGEASRFGSRTLLSNRDWGDGFFEERKGDAEVEYFDVTYTVGRKREVDGEKYEAKSAREILLISK